MPDRVADVTRIVQGGRARGLSDDQIRALVARYDERQKAPAEPPPQATPAADPRTAGIGSPRVRGWMDQLNQRSTELRQEAVEHPIRTAATVALAAVPYGRIAKAAKPLMWPTRAAAGAKFQQVMSKAANVPVDISGPGNVALRIQELAERGSSMPMVARRFLQRVTDPNKGPLTYQEARDFASNVSRLSANEFGRLTPKMGAEVHKLRVALNKAVGDAATSAGKGPEYFSAMKEYARAARHAETAKLVKKEAAKYLIPGGLAYAGYRTFVE